jgi:hypothetical protein
MSDPGFEGIGDFGSADPWQRHIAHQAAKGNYPPRYVPPTLDPEDPADDRNRKYDTAKEFPEDA